MLGLLAPTLIAILAARAFGGSLRGLWHTQVRGWPAIVLAFAVELVLYSPPIDVQPWALVLGPWLWLATKLVLLWVVVLNARSGTRWPWLLAGLGLALNTLAIAANAGHMPQSI